MKILWIGPWVNRIDWCEWHWCGSTYIVVRLSDINSKTAYFKNTKNAFFAYFWADIRQPYNHISWTTQKPFASINSTKQRTNMKFSWKNIENWRSWKMSFFLVGHFDFFQKRQKWPDPTSRGSFKWSHSNLPIVFG